MPRGRLNEKHVQQVALDWLVAYYTGQADVRAVHAEMETVVSTQSRLGNGRADGLVVVLMPDGALHTAALEAKSSRTLPNISLRYRDGHWVLHAAVAGVLGLLLTGLLGWFFGATWLLMWLLPAVAFFGVAFVYLLVTHQHARYRLIDVIRQVKRYPANEQWVALSADAYNKLADDLQAALKADCRKEGIGLLRVRSATQVTLLEKPQLRTPPKGLTDFLGCYARSSVIRQKLHSK